jgi:hypothetical protein
MPLTFNDVDARVQVLLQNNPGAPFNVRSLPYVGRHFTRKLSNAGIFSSADLLRVCAARADPGNNMPPTAAGRQLAVARMREFISSLVESPRASRCVRGSHNDHPPAAAAAALATYLVRNINPGAFWAITAFLARSWPANLNAAARIAAVVALTGGNARHLRRQDILVLRQSVLKPRALGGQSNAAAATCTCRTTAASCASARQGANPVCAWLAHGQAAQGLPNWQTALASGVCLPRQGLNLGSSEPVPGWTRGVEPAPYPPPGQAAQAALVGAGGAAAAQPALYTRRGGRHFMKPIGLP